MRDPKRITRILRGVYLIWRANPDLRLLQLLMNAAMQEGGLSREGSLPATFQFLNFEDDDMEVALQALAAETSAIDQLGVVEAFGDVIIRHDG